MPWRSANEMSLLNYQSTSAQGISHCLFLFQIFFQILIVPFFGQVLERPAGHGERRFFFKYFFNRHSFSFSNIFSNNDRPFFGGQVWWRLQPFAAALQRQGGRGVVQRSSLRPQRWQARWRAGAVVLLPRLALLLCSCRAPASCREGPCRLPGGLLLCLPCCYRRAAWRDQQAACSERASTGSDAPARPSGERRRRRRLATARAARWPSLFRRRARAPSRRR